MAYLLALLFQLGIVGTTLENTENIESRGETTLIIGDYMEDNID